MTVGRFSLKPFFPLPQTELAHIGYLRHAKCGELVNDCSTDLDFRDLPIEVTRRETWTMQFNTMLFRLEAASAVIASQLTPQRKAQLFRGSGSFVSRTRTGRIKLPQVSRFTVWNDRMGK
jgi:hypothetical protein